MATPKTTKKRLILLDTHAIIHRAYHAIPNFSTSTGEPTGGLYGLSTMLLKIIEDLQPDYIVAAYDLPKKTFRHEVYDGYKAGRKATDDDLKTQLARSREIFEAFSIPIYDAPGFEADDILGTIASQLKSKKDIEVIIATGDMDTLQLVDGSRVKVFTLKKGITDTIMYDEKAVLERFGFGPEHVADYKGLRGDPSDNIIGVHGIGEKTATTLITQFGTIENLYKVLKKNPEKVKAAGLSDRIIQLLLDNEEEALFSKTLATISTNVPISFSLPEKSFLETVSAERITNLFRTLEFRSLLARIEKTFGGNGVVLGVEKEAESVPPEEIEKTAIALWVVNSDITDGGIKDILAFGKTDSFTEAKEKIEKALVDENLTLVYNEIERPLYDVVKEMERTGVAVDKNVFISLIEKYKQRIVEIEKKVYELAGEEFNLASPKQLGEILFKKLGLVTKARNSKLSTKAEVLESLRDAHPIVPLMLEHREYAKLVSTYLEPIPTLVAPDGRLHARFIQHGSTTGRFSSANPNLQNLPIRTESGREIRKAFIAKKGSVLLSLDYSQIELRMVAILSGDPTLTDIFKTGKDVHTSVAVKVFGVKENEVTPEMRRRAKVINFGIIYGMGISTLQKNLGSTRAEAQQFYDTYFAEFAEVRGFLEKTKKFAETHYYTETLFGRKRRFPALRSPLPFMRALAERMATNAPLQGTAADIIKLAICFADSDIKKAGLIEKARLVMQIHDELVYEVEEGIAEQVLDIVRKAMEGVLERSYLHYKTVVPLSVSGGVGPTLYDLK